MTQSSIDILKRLAVGENHSRLRLAVLSAHPDDETIGASVVLARFPQTQIIFLTDGAPRDQKLWPPQIFGSREYYADLRRQEATRALSHAGIATQQLHWLGAVDQESIRNARELARALALLLAQLHCGLLITHPYEGGHPDHDCAALVGKLAVERSHAPILLCEMTSYHAHNGQCVTGEFLNSDDSNEFVFELTAQDREHKRRMMDEYKSQRLVLENFPIVAERLRIAPQYDFINPPHEGELWYEHMGWSTSKRWGELAAAAFANAQEYSCD